MVCFPVSLFQGQIRSSVLRQNKDKKKKKERKEKDKAKTQFNDSNADFVEMRLSQ